MTTEQRLDRLEGLHEIGRLVAEYSHGADKRDLARFLSVWHEDAVWDVGVARFTGVEEIAAAIRRQWEAQPAMTHWTANLAIELPLGSERAEVEVDANTLTRLAGGAWLQTSGTYRDVVERRAGRWAFASRSAVVHDTVELVSR